MKPQAWQRARALFEELLDLAGEERQARLARRAADDGDLRQEVERLLRLHAAEEAGARCEPPGPSLVERAASARVSTPERIGPYTIIGELGCGGMGTVYQAEEAHPHRRVALKILRGAWAHPRARERFALEIETLARLRHPGIASVLQAGECADGAGGGLPWFAMELVPGARTLIAAARELALRERVELFVRVCAAVHHGHLNGVVHRDLKPSNLLVGEDGAPKVIDFGVARAATREAASDLTRAGEVIGTPAYMSPEQFDGRADVRSDVWALGVVLHELLCGKLPYDLAGKSLTEAARIVQGGSPPALRRALPAAPRELEWIVARALEREPERRYASAGELGADLERWLAGQPVRAGSPGALYRVASWARRHRVGVSALAAIVLTLLGGIWGTTRGMLRAREEARTASASLELLVDLFRSPDPALDGREVRVLDALARAQERLAADLADQPAVQATLLSALGRLDHNLGQHERAQAELVRAHSLLAGLDDPPEMTLDALRADLGLVRMELGRLEESEADLTACLAWRREELGEAHAETGAALNSLALLRQRQRRLEEAEELARQATLVLSAAQGANDPHTLAARMNLTSILLERSRFDEARAELPAVVEALRRELGDEHPLSIKGMNNLAALLAKERRFAEARPLMVRALEVRREILPPGHPELDGAASNLASVHILLGELDLAEPLLEGIVERRSARAPLFAPETLVIFSNLMTLHVQRRDLDALDDLLQRVYDAETGALAGEVRTAEILETAARYLQRTGFAPRGRRVAEEALAVRVRLQGAEHAQTLIARALVVGLQREELSPSELSSHLADLHASACRSLAEGHYARGALGHELARALMAEERFAEAEPILLAAAEVLAAQGSAFEARAAAQSCVELFSKLGKEEEATAWRTRAEAQP